MIRVFLAENQPETRSALRLLLLDLNMQVVGEADNWTAVIEEAALTQPDMIVVDWELIPTDSSLLVLRDTCPAAVVIVLISNMDSRRQAAFSAGADSFISKDETPDRVAQRLRDAVANVRVYQKILVRGAAPANQNINIRVANQSDPGGLPNESGHI